MTRVLLSLSILLIGFEAHAADLTREEKTWATACVRRLDSESDSVRAGAVAALQALGTKAVVAIVVAARDIDTETGWDALLSVFRSEDPIAWRDALLACQSRWPKGQVDQMSALVDRLEAVKIAAAPPNPDIEKKVREQIDAFEGARMYSSSDLRVRRIIALGRPAVPVLVKILREGENMMGFKTSAASDALARLVTKDDLPMLAALLKEGVLSVAKCLNGMPGDAARDALVAPLATGFLDHTLMDALKNRGDDVVVADALVEFLKRHGMAGAEVWSVASVAEYVGELGRFDAVPILEKILDSRLEHNARSQIAIGLMRLGVRRAIPILIETVERGATDEWRGQRAGEVLNELVRKEIFVQASRERAGGNFAEAAGAFQKWWAKNGEKLVFEPKLRVWKLR